MGEGRGKGGDNAGVIAAGCCAIYCMVCFFLVGLPMLITGIVLVRIAEGDYDDRVVDSIAECRLDNALDCFESDDCNGKCATFDQWEDAKDAMRIAGIILIVLSLISVVAGIVMVLLMFTTLCKKSSTPGGVVHSQPMPMSQPAYVYDNQGANPQQPGYQHKPGYP